MYKIGELSKLCNMTVKTLRYYDNIGLLVPDEIDSLTGYRYYSASKLAECNRIAALKELGFSLQEIIAHVRADSPEEISSLIDGKIAELHTSLSETQAHIKRLTAIKEIISGGGKIYDIAIKSYDSFHAAYIRKHFPSEEDALKMLDEFKKRFPPRLIGRRTVLINYENEYEETNLNSFDIAICVELKEKLPENGEFMQREISFSGDVASVTCKIGESRKAAYYMEKQLCDMPVHVIGPTYNIFYEDGTCERKVPVQKLFKSDVPRDGTVKFYSIEGRYDYIHRFSCGRAFVRHSNEDRRIGFVDRTGRIAIPLDYYDQRKNSEGYIKIISDPGFSEDRAALLDEKGRFGYIDINGSKITEFEYDHALSFCEGRAAVKKSGSDGKWGYIDRSGNTVIPCIYDWAYWFSGGLAPVVKDGKLGYIDINGNELTDFGYDFFADPAASVSIGFSQDSDGGCYAAVSKNGIKYFIDQNGNVVNQHALEYDYVSAPADGLATIAVGEYDDPFLAKRAHMQHISRKRKWGFVDITGKVVIEPEYDIVFYNGDIVILKNENENKNYFMDKSGKVLFVSEHDWVGGSYDGLICVRKNNKYGYINIRGETIIPLEYDAAKAFSEGYAPVMKNGRFGYIDKSGLTVTDFEYDSAGCVGEGIGIVKKGRQWGLVDFSL